MGRAAAAKKADANDLPQVWMEENPSASSDLLRQIPIDSPALAPGRFHFVQGIGVQMALAKGAEGKMGDRRWLSFPCINLAKAVEDSPSSIDRGMLSVFQNRRPSLRRDS